MDCKFLDYPCEYSQECNYDSLKECLIHRDMVDEVNEKTNRRLRETVKKRNLLIKKLRKSKFIHLQ